MPRPETQFSLPLASAAAATDATAHQETALLDIKGISLPVMHLAVTSLVPEEIAAALKQRFGKNAARFFENAPALLDLSRLPASTKKADWAGVRAQLAEASLQLIGVYGGDDKLEAEAKKAGLALIEDVVVPVARHTPAPAAEEVVEPAPAKPQQAEPAEAASTAENAAPAASPDHAPAITPSAAALVIDKPLRSGQRVYARGSDLVVLAMVSAGAEVIADGNIHIYAPLRGRALAGAQGDTQARIFTTSFEAELVSVAGVYRTFETPESYADLAHQPVQVSLVSDPQAPAAEPRLCVQALSIR